MTLSLAKYIDYIFMLYPLASSGFNMLCIHRQMEKNESKQGNVTGCTVHNYILSDQLHQLIDNLVTHFLRFD